MREGGDGCCTLRRTFAFQRLHNLLWVLGMSLLPVVMPVHQGAEKAVRVCMGMRVGMRVSVVSVLMVVVVRLHVAFRFLALGLCRVCTTCYECRHARCWEKEERGGGMWARRRTAEMREGGGRDRTRRVGCTSAMAAPASTVECLYLSYAQRCRKT